ncbi:MAG: hypothetical protein ACM3MI_07310 [Clostridiales bacterium]
MTNEDICLYIKLTDKYNTKFIDSIIDACKNKLICLFNNDEYLDCNVYFKPKKINDSTKEVEFRPIHTTSLINQICIVSMLNLLMFDDSDGTRKLSDISRLLPSNFYGNLPSTSIEHIFKPWTKQYQKYSQNAIAAHRKYHTSHKYVNEINLDIKQFYPSVDPLFILEFILQKWPITSSTSEVNFLKLLLEKILFFKLKLSQDTLALYYPNEILHELLKCNNIFNKGLPQGLPQAYFFGNICMALISKHINSEFEGDSYYYVDDSVIYSSIPKEEFEKKIGIVNDKINIEISKYKGVSHRAEINEFCNLNHYYIEIHNSGKSSISEITDETSLYNFAKPASAISFEIKASLDEVEDTSLQKKIVSILSLIEYKLKQINSNEKKSDTSNSDENTLKLLQRYKKFYTNRLNILKLRNENELNEENISAFFSKYGLKATYKESDFFNKLEDDVFNVESKLFIQQLHVRKELQVEIINVIKTFESSFHVSSETPHYFSTVLSNYAEFQNYKSEEYASLEERTFNSIESFDKVKQDQKIEIIRSLVQSFTTDNKIDPSGKPFLKILNEFSNNYYYFIFKNSPQFVRKLINAILSKALNIALNESCNFLKLDNRSIYYYELRILMLIRNNNFSLQTFTKITNQILNELDQKQHTEKIDLSLLGVLPNFRMYIKDLDKVDSLILVHKYICSIWKNGSKFLHFYTLHNEDHSIELINNCIKITKTIDYLTIKADDYYILFLCCYLHDISMVLYPNLDDFNQDNAKTDLIYSKWKISVSDLKNIEVTTKTSVKKLILDYYNIVNDHFEYEIRSNHHKTSSRFIRNQVEFDFIDKSKINLIADVCEAHGYNTKDVYKLKSKAKENLHDEKYLMIILRLADLLDMSKDRVSINILRQNINNMSDSSKFHWISHMIIDTCSISSDFPVFEKTSPHSTDEKLEEKITIYITLNTRLLTASKSDRCNNMRCHVEEGGIKPLLRITIGQDNKCIGKCNFMCKWIARKHNYLFQELIELNKYLDRTSSNIFKTKIEVILNFENLSIIPSDYVDIVRREIE